jgi:hypothetical protein
MKKILATALALAFIASAAVAETAQPGPAGVAKPAIATAAPDGASTTTASAADTASVAKKSSLKHGAKRAPAKSGTVARAVKKLAGVIESIVPGKGDGAFVVRVGKRDYRFTLAPAAKVRDARGDKIGLSGLKKGIKVVVSYKITAKGDEAVGVKAVI